MIEITKKGLRGTGTYIGRPSPYGNPFPTKKSKYSKEIYTLEKSLKKYESLIRHGVINISDLVNKYNKDGKLILDCYCINKTINAHTEIDLDNCKCHGEIITYYILLFTFLKK